ncbi:MAG TPA: adenylyl-sulfate kinase [Acidimicrobiales bacterium]|nr:adenylyl-sulfate kinase [Acidimicrobiales bacterium]
MSDEQRRGLTVWLTGLPGSGKTTSGNFLLDALLREGVSATSLDGDVLRAGISADLGFGPEDRDENVRRAGEIALMLASQGEVVIVSLVSPRRAARDGVRQRHRTRGVGFLEVHVAAPLAVCEERDPKALYRRAREGGLAHMTGVDDPYEPPTKPDLVLATDLQSVEDTGAQLIDAVRQTLGVTARRP